MPPLFAHLAVWEDREPREAPLQMAIDRALLETSTVPVLRAYTWARACVTIGYFGPEEEAALAHPGLPIIRRWTGGGTVLHGEDAPYSLIVPRTAPFASVRPAESYRAIHGILATVLEPELPGVHTAAETAPKRSSACFENPVADDLLLGGCKVAGAGQRRTRAGLLHQGSVQIGCRFFEPAHRFARALSPSTENFAETPAQSDEILSLALKLLR